jgi:hypothetical protein
VWNEVLEWCGRPYTVINPHKAWICSLWKILWETFERFFEGLPNICVIAAC